MIVKNPNDWNIKKLRYESMKRNFFCSAFMEFLIVVNIFNFWLVFFNRQLFISFDSQRFYPFTIRESLSANFDFNWIAVFRWDLSGLTFKRFSLDYLKKYLIYVLDHVICLLVWWGVLSDTLLEISKSWKH